MSQYSKSDVEERVKTGESFAGENLADIDLSGAQLVGIESFTSKLERCDIEKHEFNPMPTLMKPIFPARIYRGRRCKAPTWSAPI